MRSGLKVAVSFLRPSQHRSWVRPVPCHPVARNSSLRLACPPQTRLLAALAWPLNQHSSPWAGPLSCWKPLSGSSRLGSGFLLVRGLVHPSTSVWAVAFAAAVPRADPSLSSASAWPLGPQSVLRQAWPQASLGVLPKSAGWGLSTAQPALSCRSGVCFASCVSK